MPRIFCDTVLIFIRPSIVSRSCGPRTCGAYWRIENSSMTFATEKPETTFMKRGGVREAVSWSTAMKRSFLVFAGSVNVTDTIILSEKLEPLRKSMLLAISLSGGNIRSILPSKWVKNRPVAAVAVTSSTSNKTHFFCWRTNVVQSEKTFSNTPFYLKMFTVKRSIQNGMYKIDGRHVPAHFLNSQLLQVILVIAERD